MKTHKFKLSIFCIRALIQRYSIIVNFGLLSILLILGGCEQGFMESRQFYFPKGSEQYGFWNAVLTVTIETPTGARSIDTNQKMFSISIRNKAGDRLYSETGEMTVGSVNSSVQWNTANSLELEIKNLDGKVILERKLEFDSSKNIYTIKK